MNNEQIDEILWRNDPSRVAQKRRYLRCFPADRLPRLASIRHFPTSLVINLDPARKEGSHWVAVVLINRRTALYWDSLALPTKGKIAEFLHQFGSLERNKRPYQNPFSDCCGHFCIAFIHYVCFQSYSYKQFLRLLAANSHPFGDGFVRKVVNKLTQ